MSYQQPITATCSGVEIFASGIFRGKEYTVANLEEIARKFSELGPNGKDLIRPPVVLGHEETQEFLEKTNLPAAAWPSRVWVEKYHDKTSGKEEAILKADFAEVAPVIAKLINTRAYRKISPEIYDNFEDDFGNGYGMALRRIVLLGGEIPQVKRLADIPLARFSERRIAAHKLLALLGRRVVNPPVLLRLIGATHNVSRGTYSCFAEVQTAMPDRAALIQQLLAAMPTLPQAEIDTMTDQQIAALVAALPSASTAATADTTAMMADLPREDMIADLVAAGQDPAALEAMSDEELKALYDSMIGATETVPEFAEMTRDEMIAQLTAAGEDAAYLATLSDEELKAKIDMAQPAAPMAEIGRPAQTTTSTGSTTMATQQRAPVRPQPKKVTLQFAERQAFAEVATIRREAAELRKSVAADRLKLAQSRRAAKRQEAESFCETLVRNGQIRPVDVPAYTAQLMMHDAEKPAVKFSEGGKEETLTSFEAKKRDLLKTPIVIRYGEKIKANAGGDDATELGKMRRIANHPMVVTDLQLTGKKPEQIIHTFSERRKKNPELTAEQHAKDLGVRPEVYS